MKAPIVVTVIKWAVALGSLVGLIVLAHFLRGQVNGDRSAEEGADATQNPRRVQNNVVKLGAQLAESYGLKDVRAEAAEWHNRITVYGRVVPNARATTEVRAPFAGTLRADREGSWPALGNRVKVGQVLAWLDVRVGPEVRLDLVIKLKEARAKLAGAEQVVKIQQEKMGRFESAGGSIAQAELDAARVQLTEAKTQLAQAKATVKQWEEALTEIDRQGERKDATWSQPLKAPRKGEITELAGTPGLAVEPGALIARIVDFRRALVRLDIPLFALAAGPPDRVELSVHSTVAPALEGASNRPEAAKPAPPVLAVLAGAVPQVETTSQSAGFWYEVDTTLGCRQDRGAENTAAPEVVGGGIWRPGLFVTATMNAVNGKPQPAVAVPETALLYHQGRALVYVRISPGRYERREVQVFGREADRWLLASGVTAGEPVVYQRAQVLLSEEFRGEADND
jgi:biotin carboxyl carrier protein